MIMRNLKKWMNAALLFCGTTIMLTSCISENDNPAPSPTVPKSYYLVADEYKEALLGTLEYEGMMGE